MTGPEDDDRILIVLQLLDRCLKIVDADLFDHLRAKNLSAELYAFPCQSESVWRTTSSLTVG